MSTPVVTNPVRVAVATTVVAILAVGGVALADTDHSSHSTGHDAPARHANVGIRDFKIVPTTSGGKVMLGP
jgi:hypothetical protein